MDDKDLPIDKRNGKPHVGTKNLKSFKPGESGNPKGRPVGSLGKKNRFKKDLLVLKWMAEDPELAELVASMDNVEMFDALMLKKVYICLSLLFTLCSDWLADQLCCDWPIA